MTNIKISDKGRAFLSKGNTAAKVSMAIATSGKNLYSREGIVVTEGKNSVIVKSASYRQLTSSRQK